MGKEEEESGGERKKSGDGIRIDSEIKASGDRRQGIINQAAPVRQGSGRLDRLAVSVATRNARPVMLFQREK